MLAELIPKLAGMEAEEKQAYYPRPSSAGPLRCIRQMVYHGLRTPEDRRIGDRFYLTIDDSTFHEYLTHDWLQKSAFVLHSAQMPLDIAVLDFMPKEGTKHCKHCDRDVPLNVLHGHPDGVITDMLGIDRHYEHKAVNRYAFDRYWKGEIPFDYLTQCCLNIVGLNKHLDTKITESILLIKNKDTAQYMDFLAKYDEPTDTAHVLEVSHSNGEKKIGSPYLLTMDNVVSGAIEKFRQVQEHIDNKTLPERPFEFGTDFPCGYCSYQDTCWAGYEKEINELAADITLEGEVIDLCRLFLEQQEYEKEAKAHKEELKKKLADVLTANNAKSGRAGDFIISRKFQHEERIMKKDDIPPHISDQIMRKNVKEIVTISKIKPKKETKKGNRKKEAK